MPTTYDAHIGYDEPGANYDLGVTVTIQDRTWFFSQPRGKWMFGEPYPKWSTSEPMQ